MKYTLLEQFVGQIKQYLPLDYSQVAVISMIYLHNQSFASLFFSLSYSFKNTYFYSFDFKLIFCSISSLLFKFSVLHYSFIGSMILYYVIFFFLVARNIFQLSGPININGTLLLYTHYYAGLMRMTSG